IAALPPSGAGQSTATFGGRHRIRGPISGTRPVLQSSSSRIPPRSSSTAVSLDPLFLDPELVGEELFRHGRPARRTERDGRCRGLGGIGGRSPASWRVDDPELPRGPFDRGGPDLGLLGGGPSRGRQDDPSPLRGDEVPAALLCRPSRKLSAARTALGDLPHELVAPLEPMIASVAAAA